MQHGIDARRLGHLVKCPRLSNVRHDDHLKLSVGSLSWMSVADLLGLGLGADGGDDGVVLFEELVEDVGCEMC